MSLSASYEIDFWGKYRDAALAADETAIASRFDRDVVALTSLVGVANAYFQVLAAQDRIRIANNNIASAQRIYDAFKQRLDVGTATDLDLAQQESALANQKRDPAALAADACAERECACRAGGPAAGERERPRRKLAADRAAARDARASVRAVDATARHPPRRGAACVRDRQCGQRPRAVLPEHHA